MPFLRLILIYIFVIAIAFAIFNRDKVMALAGFSAGGPMIEAQEDAPAEEEESTAATATESDIAEVETPKVVVETKQAEVAKTVAETQPPADIAAAEKPQETARTKTTPQKAASMAQRLDKTRKAFWSGDLNTAERDYGALADEYPQDANIQGEVGNFYFAQRKFKKAADYFHKAGLLLIKSGNRQQVVGVINALQGFAPEKAADLRAKASQ